MFVPIPALVAVGAVVGLMSFGLYWQHGEIQNLNKQIGGFQTALKTCADNQTTLRGVIDDKEEDTKKRLQAEKEAKEAVERELELVRSDLRAADKYAQNLLSQLPKPGESQCQFAERLIDEEIVRMRGGK